MTNEPTIIGRYNYTAESFQVDFMGRLSMSVLGNHILNVAGENANDNGFGLGYLNEHNYTWVLSRLAIELDEMPCEHDQFTIETWVESVLSLFSGRDFAILNAEGKAVGHARSVWAMIDMNTRQPVNLLELRDGVMTKVICQERQCPIAKPGKIRVKADTPAGSFTVRYSDIDINVHLNSVRSIEHILDLLPMDTYRVKRLKRFEIAYMAEAHYGDTLDLYLDSDGDVHQVEMRNRETGEAVCRAKVVMEDPLP